VAIWQDSNADNALEALMDLQAQKCTVIRNGEWITDEASNLVPGDVVKIATGDCVPADLRVVEIQSISLNAGQAALTGESVSVRKTTTVMGSDASMLQDQKNMLFSSTTVNQGNAIGVVAYTGMKTAIGSVQNEVSQAKEDEADTPLKQKLDQFSDQLAKVIFVICGLVWIMNFSKFWDPIHGGVVKGCIYYFKIAVALAVAAIPEGLPAVITTCLALGTRKMAANNCIVRRLPSVETLGCTSTICSDKTGTLTKNLMCTVKFGVIGDSARNMMEFDVEESEYSPESNIKNLSKQNFEQNKNLEKMALVCAMNNRSRIAYESGAYKNQGEPTEAALKVFAEKICKLGNSNKVDFKANPNAHADDFEKKYKRVATLDFSSERKTMSTVIAGSNGSNWVLLKGAPERVLEKCNGYFQDNGSQKSF
jgi:magnesium-transporting ATPase (P-type)